MDNISNRSMLIGKPAARTRKGRDNDRARKVVILVAGMHRSGTSAVARTLSLLGCDLPKTLMPRTRFNEAGYWESVPVINLNEEILTSAGSAWDDWEVINPNWYASPVKDGFRSRAQVTLKDEFGASGMFVLKDPRICRLLPFWIDALKTFRAEPLYISPIRNPLDVAASLEERDKIDPSIGTLLWLRHVLDAEFHSRSLRRAYIRYEEFLVNWQALIGRLSEEWSIAWPRQSAAVELEIDSFLSQTHRHHATDDRQVFAKSGLSHWIRSSFGIFDRWTRGEVRDTDTVELDQIRTALDEAAPAFARPIIIGRQALRRTFALEQDLGATQDQVTQLGGVNAAHESELARSRIELGKLEGSLTARNAELVQREEQIGALENALASGKAELAQSQQLIAELKDELAAQEAEACMSLARIHDLERAGLARTTELAAAAGRIWELEETVANLEGRLAARDAEVDRSFARISDLEHADAAREIELAEGRGRICDLKEAADRRNTELAEKTAQIGKLMDALKGRDAEALERTEQVSALEQAVDARDRALLEKEADTGRLRRAAAEKDTYATALQLTILALRRSTSWRITSPLRRAKRAASRLRYSFAGHSLTLTWRALWTMSRAPLLDLQIARAIARSDLFDRSWYLKKYPDVAESGLDPVCHYIVFGAREGRDPCAVFGTQSYLAQNPDVAAAGVNPLGHYLRYGKDEGRALAPSNLSIQARYEDWIKIYDTLEPAHRKLIQANISHLKTKPTISILMPVYNTDLKWLAAAIDSVTKQLYPHWELCVSDDASTLPGLHDLLQQAARDDRRIKLHFRDKRGHISANTNSALALASGEFAALLDADDELTADALYWVAREIDLHPNVGMIFSDEDKIDEDGRRFDPYFKSDWNPALMLSQNAFCHLGVFRRSLLIKLAGLREGFEGAQDYDLALRAADATSPEHIRHISRILYHWRVRPGSTAAGVEAKPYAWDAGRRAICDHLARRRIGGSVRAQLGHVYQVEYDAPAQWPNVAIIWPSTLKTDVSRRCLELLLERTTYPDFSVIVMLHVSDAERHFGRSDTMGCDSNVHLLREPRVRVVTYNRKPFNYSWVNNVGVSEITSEYICFLNDDVEVITPDWLQVMVLRTLQKGVGAVGAMLYYPDDTIQHAGVILGIGGVADHAFRKNKRGSEGYFGKAALEQDLSCVTAACMVIRREAFEQAGRFDEGLPCAFNDVDLCIKLRQKGWRIVWTPVAELYHHESMTFGSHSHPDRADQFDQDVRTMRQRWGPVLDADPFYSLNLALEPCNQFGLAFPPRIGQGV